MALLNATTVKILPTLSFQTLFSARTVLFYHVLSPLRVEIAVVTVILALMLPARG